MCTLPSVGSEMYRLMLTLREGERGKGKNPSAPVTYVTDRYVHQHLLLGTIFFSLSLVLPLSCTGTPFLAS